MSLESLHSVTESLRRRRCDLRYNRYQIPGNIFCRIMLKMCEGKLEDENGRIEIHTTTKPLFFPKESPLVEALYKAYTDVTGDTENKPLVIGGGTYAKSLKNIIAFGPEKPGVDYHIHGASSTLVSELKKQYRFTWKQLRTCLQSNQNSSCRKNDHL